MKKYKVAAYCQDNVTKVESKKLYLEFDINAENEEEAENKADRKYKKLMGFTADTIEVIAEIK